MASYVVLSLVMGSFSFGLVQIRISELLMVLALKDREYIMPLTLGCLLSNLLGVMSGMDVMVMDILLGSIATLISGILVYLFRDIRLHGKPLLSLLMPPLVNGLIVGLELHLILEIDFFLAFLYVFMGELVAVTILGLLLGDALCQSIDYLKK